MGKMTLSEDLLWRNLVKDKTFQDIKWLDTPKAFYLGIDCSADSLTIGNLAVLLLAKRLTTAGWKAVLLVGGATSLIGDPGGKDEERNLKSREEIQVNVLGIQSQIKQLFNSMEFQLVDNYDWFKDIKFLDFLRDVGKQYSMTELVQRDFISSRMGEDGSGISYAEFSYNLIQGYDYYHLFKNYEVVMQIGGSDQWGNMLSGVPLIRKKDNAEVQAMSMPLIVNNATGKKFGKSEEGAVWLDSTKTSPLKFYQFWVNVDDAGLETYLKVYTELDKDEIEAVIKEHSNNPSLRVGQKKLAELVTQLVHGKEMTTKVQVATDVITGNRSISDIDEESLSAIRSDLVSSRVNLPSTISDALVQTGLASSKGEARRLLESKAIYLNGKNAESDTFSEADFQNGRLLLRRGKAFKDTVLIELDR